MSDVETLIANRKYEAGFSTDIETEIVPKGLDEDVVRLISSKKNEPEWLTEWRLAAYRHWLTMTPPHWAKLAIAPIDFQAISYFAAPKNRPKSLDEVDPELLKTYDKLGVPLHERARLAGVAVDAVFDSVSVGTTFQKELRAAGVSAPEALALARDRVFATGEPVLPRSLSESMTWRTLVLTRVMPSWFVSGRKMKIVSYSRFVPGSSRMDTCKVILSSWIVRAPEKARERGRGAHSHHSHTGRVKDCFCGFALLGRQARRFRAGRPSI